jgi:lipoprotein NlpI
MRRCHRSTSLVLVVVLGSMYAAAADESAQSLIRQALALAERGPDATAVDLLTMAIEKDAKLSVARYFRGRENFRLGRIKESLADFDAYVKLEPQLESRQWERGIACFYAGKFDRGAKQFELYQTYHDQDVENSTWRYLCLVPSVGVAKAQATMLPIKRDTRVPMMQIYDLYGGKLMPEEVLAAAKAGNPSEEALNNRLFYAHLYLGLWFEANGKPAEAREHILEAEKHKIGHYMWDVAHVHAERLRQANN